MRFCAASVTGFAPPEPCQSFRNDRSSASGAGKWGLAMATDTRGIVVSNPICIEGDSLLNCIISRLDPQELRSGLLFWDKIDFPSNNLVTFPLNQDEEFLISIDILSRTHINLTGIIADDGSVTPLHITAPLNLATGEKSMTFMHLPMFRHCHVTAFRALDEREPGVWSLATGERSISFLDDELDMDRGALVSIHHAIPVPDKDVPLEDILKFKTRRRDELLSLRHHLDGIYQRVLNAGDGPLALNSEISALERAIVDHMKAAKDSGLVFRWSGLDASINVWPGAVTAGVLLSQGLSLPEALVAGGAAALSVSVGAGLKAGRIQPTPFRYISRYHDELFGGGVNGAPQ
jgi:hypothetical protein